MMVVPVLTPHGALTLRRDTEASSFEPARRDRLERAFHRGHLGEGAAKPALPVPSDDDLAATCYYQARCYVAVTKGC
jgi:hypothetical protein